jgi:hypothetical protein
MAISAFCRPHCATFAACSLHDLWDSKSSPNRSGRSIETNDPVDQTPRFANFLNARQVLVLFPDCRSAYLVSGWTCYPNSIPENHQWSNTEADDFLIADRFFGCLNSPKMNSF